MVVVVVVIDDVVVVDVVVVVDDIVLVDVSVVVVVIAVVVIDVIVDVLLAVRCGSVRSQVRAPLRLIGTSRLGAKVRFSWNKLNPQEYLPCFIPISYSDFAKGAIDDWPRGNGH